MNDISRCPTPARAVHFAGSDAAVRRQVVRALSTLAAVKRKLLGFSRMHARLVVAHVVRVLEEFSALVALSRFLFCERSTKVSNIRLLTSLLNENVFK